MYLDQLPLLSAEVGFGKVGMNGHLGYEDRTVSVRNQCFPHSFSAHPPARLRFQLDARFGTFKCGLALNDDVPRGRSHADFAVIGDGREVAIEPFVTAGGPARSILANVSGVKYLDLVVGTSRWEYAHAVWLDPQVQEGVPESANLIDCLGRAEFALPSSLPRADRCIATVVSPGFEFMLDDMLGSLLANGGCQDALLLVISLDGNQSCARVAAKYGATVIRGTPRALINPMSKAVLYSVARLADAEKFLCLDADMLVLGDLNPVFGALEACPEGSILCCREGNNTGLIHLERALREIYGGNERDIDLLAITGQEAAYRLVVNDGLFAGTRGALLALDGLIRSMPDAAKWADSHPRVWWRNQFIFNLALARLDCGVEIDSRYNLQLHVQDVKVREEGARLCADWRGRPAHVLHFNGGAKHKYPECRRCFASVQDPLSSPGDGDGYGLFLAALRAWVGRRGVSALTWSFYGLTDGLGASVRDPSTLPLLAALHYLIRANGCRRVLETGTARGVSAACLASAVYRRPNARVVTLDPALSDGRDHLWATLPGQMASCIEARTIGSIEGMSDAISAGELYDAILLDSIHEQSHAWAEFQLAARLVCPAGLILIHDATYAYGTVEAALHQIEEAGYNVVRLWAAEQELPEDDHLGLAVIENRIRQSSTVAEKTHSTAADRPPLPQSQGQSCQEGEVSI